MAHNALEVAPEGLKWNGAGISTTTLAEYLRQMNELNPHVNLQVIFDSNTDCEQVNQTRSLVSRDLRCGPTQACVEYSEPEYKTQLKRHAVY